MQKIHQLTKRGESHKNHCEDALFVVQTDNCIAAAVFDGCSSGYESHFASALLAKIFRKQSRLAFGEVVESRSFDALFGTILYESLHEMAEVYFALELEVSEVLSSVVFLLADYEQPQARIICLGDGVVALDGVINVIDQNNMPDYPAYHIEQFKTRELFDAWLNEQQNVFDTNNVSDLCISTDGLLSFVDAKMPNTDAQPLLNETIPPFFALDTMLVNTPAMLGRKCNILKNKQNLTHYDDLGIVRIVAY